VEAALIVVIVLIVVLVLGGVALVGRRRGPSERPTTGRVPDPARGAAPAPADDDGAGVAVREPPSTTVADDSTATDLEAAELEELLPEVEVPAPTAGRLARLRGRLARSQSTLGHGLLTLLSRDRVDDETWDEVEETLLLSDLGVEPTRELVDTLRARARVDGARDPEQVRAMLREALVDLVDPTLDRTLDTRRTPDGKPAVVLVVGVNGTGKTTTTGKLARVLVAEDREVLLGAADTFRAAAADQLQTWGERVGVVTIRGAEGADPASVAFRAVETGVDEEVDVVLVDTAGRLHTKTGLMDELGKVKRVVEKLAPVSEVLLVIDATTGQNGLRQARVFADAVDVTGLVLTKLDGTAKGGIVVAVQRELGVPVKLVGLGEGVDDLAPFDAESFVDALLDQP
jgi:fused signal recognition particle receptor